MKHRVGLQPFVWYKLADSRSDDGSSGCRNVNNLYRNKAFIL